MDGRLIGWPWLAYNEPGGIFGLIFAECCSFAFATGTLPYEKKFDFVALPAEGIARLAPY